MNFLKIILKKEDGFSHIVSNRIVSPWHDIVGGSTLLTPGKNSFHYYVTKSCWSSEVIEAKTTTNLSSVCTCLRFSRFLKWFSIEDCSVIHAYPYCKLENASSDVVCQKYCGLIIMKNISCFQWKDLSFYTFHKFSFFKGNNSARLIRKFGNSQIYSFFTTFFQTFQIQMLFRLDTS